MSHDQYSHIRQQFCGVNDYCDARGSIYLEIKKWQCGARSITPATLHHAITTCHTFVIFLMKYYCTTPTCISASNGVCGPYCGNSLYPCPGGTCNPMDSCGPAPQECPDVRQCTSSALKIITQRWPAVVVIAISQVVSEFQTCLTDVENDLPLITCMAACGQFESDVLQTVECVVSCVVENGVLSSCVTLLGEVALAAIAASSLEGAILVMYV